MPRPSPCYGRSGVRSGDPVHTRVAIVDVGTRARRTHAYKDAGSDAIFAIAPSLEHAKFFRTQVDGPMAIIRTLGTAMHRKENRLEYDDALMKATAQELYEIGYEIRTEPSHLLGVAVNAMMRAALKERQSGAMIDLEEHGNLYDVLDTWMDVPEVRRIRQTYCDPSSF